MTTYSLKTIRLVNFHNFVDAVIPVQGHLFLVGDNASGKTTVLDAVQWVLSGGQDLEFNAAAQLWGVKQDGRTLRGAVLRTDLEKGHQRLRRTVTYAAVELETEEGARLSLGVGAELAHPEAQLQTWGFIKPGPLSEVPLVLEESGAGPRPLTKEELRERLGDDRVFFQIGRYQKILADRFTRGEESFKRLTEFWKISKAYKQMAEKTRDYSELLRHMLPKPDGESFQQVRRGMADLAAVEDRLNGLRAQRDYLDRLREGLAEVGRHREAASRYVYLESHWVWERAGEALVQAESDAERIRRESEAARSGLSSAQADLAARESELQDVRAKDREGLLERRERLAREATDAQSARDEARKIVDEKSMAVARAAKRLGSARRDLGSRLAEVGLAVAEAVGTGGPHLAEVTSALAEAERDETPEQAWTRLDSRPARREIQDLQAGVERELRYAASLAREAEAQERRWDEELDRWERTPDPLPDLPRYGDCLVRLERENLKAQPLYRLIEKSVDGDETLFRDLEAALGERVLAALVPEPEDAARTARIVLEEFPGIPVARTDLPPLPPAPWLEGLVAWDRLSEEARSYLRRLAEPGSTPGLLLEGGGRVEERGARRRVLPLSAPLLGVESRRADRQRRIEEAGKHLERARADRARIGGDTERLERRGENLRRALAFLSEIREGDLLRLAQESAQAAAADARSRDEADRAREEQAQRAEQAERAARALNTLKARLAQEGLEDLEAKLAAAEAALAAAKGREREELERQGELKRAGETARQAIEARAAEVARAQSVLEDRARSLSPLVPEDHRRDLAAYVLDAKQGRRVASLENVREKIREAERAYDVAVARLEGEGGVLHPEYGPLFGLTYDESAHRIVHRNGQPLEVFLEGFAAQVRESEEVLTRDRRNLFEEVIQGHLARRLQREISDLEQTVRDADRLLRARVFGQRTRYRIRFHPREEHAHFIAVVKRLAAFDAAGQEEFQAEIRDRLAALPSDGTELPEAFDYRHWYEFQLLMGGETEEGVPLKPQVARLGSGGEQAVPKYIIILAMASLLFRASESALPVLLFDEVFYGIDKARREELLTLATEMGFQLVVASPEQAGDRESYRRATTAFVVKDAANDVHIVPAHVWTDRPADLFAAPAGDNGTT